MFEEGGGSTGLSLSLSFEQENINDIKEIAIILVNTFIL
jgi:hypothetical protein